MSEMKKTFNIAEETETRVWNKYMSNSCELLANIEHTVQDAGLYQGQVRNTIVNVIYYYCTQYIPNIAFLILCYGFIFKVLVIEKKSEDGTWPRQTRQRY